MAVIVPIVSKKSASIRVKTNSAAVTTPTRPNEPKQRERARAARSRGRRRPCRGNDGTLRFQPVGVELLARHGGTDVRDRLDDGGQHRRGEDRDQDGAAHVADVERRSSAAGRTRRRAMGQPSRKPVAPSCTGTVVFDASGIRRTKPESTRPMNAMNRPMPTLIAVFSWRRHGVEDRAAEAGQDQDQDDQALEHHQAHRVLPGHSRGDRERDEGVEAEPGGQRQREVRHDAHEDRHHPRDQGRAGGDQRRGSGRCRRRGTCRRRPWRTRGSAG